MEKSPLSGVKRTKSFNKQTFGAWLARQDTHVFFDRERPGAENSRQLAQLKLAELNRQRAPFTDAVKHGSRFLYHTNYAERSLNFVASHFDKAIAAELFELEPSNSEWRGPYSSPYGSHVVMLVARQEGQTPPLDGVREREKADARRALIRERTEQAAVDRVLQHPQPIPAVQRRLM